MENVDFFESPPQRFKFCESWVESGFCIPYWVRWMQGLGITGKTLCPHSRDPPPTRAPLLLSQVPWEQEGPLTGPSRPITLQKAKPRSNEETDTPRVPQEAGGRARGAKSLALKSLLFALMRLMPGIQTLKSKGPH